MPCIGLQRLEAPCGNRAPVYVVFDVIPFAAEYCSSSTVYPGTLVNVGMYAGNQYCWYLIDSGVGHVAFVSFGATFLRATDTGAVLCLCAMHVQRCPLRAYGDSKVPPTLRPCNIVTVTVYDGSSSSARMVLRGTGSSVRWCPGSAGVKLLALTSVLARP